MGIDAAWITEAGMPEEEVFDPHQYLTQLATTRWPKLTHTKCLQFVDPWGDAVFNQSQIPVLLQELNSELPEIREAEARSHLESVIRLVQRAIDQTHTYIKFIGD